MTEQQREEDSFLNELLSRNPAGFAEQPAPNLTRGDEMRLLEEAHAAGTPTLAPIDDTLTLEDEPAPARQTGDGRFASDMARLIRRYPLAAASLALGAAFLLARRRH